MIKLSDEWNIVDPFGVGAKCLNHAPCYDATDDSRGCACSSSSWLRCYTCHEWAPKEVANKYKFITENNS